jgi:hypothetical protein
VAALSQLGRDEVPVPGAAAPAVDERERTHGDSVARYSFAWGVMLQRLGTL